MARFRHLLRPKSYLIIGVLLGLLGSLPAWAHETAASKKTHCASRSIEPEFCVVYNHSSHSFVGTPSLEVGDGEVFYLVIINTAPHHFTYPVEGFEERFKAGREAALVPTLETFVIPIEHESRFGGYLFSIGVPAQQPKSLVVEGQRLTVTPEPRAIVVKTAGWEQSLAGAFTMSNLTDPVFSVRTGMDGDGNSLLFVDETPNQEDEARLGLGAFIHLYHSRWNRSFGRGGPALSFGLGLDSESEVSYYLGPSYRFGDKGAITAGIVFGPEARLPGGVETCGREADCGPSLAVDANVLSNLDTQNELGAFISLSYSFLKVDDLIKKPFKALSAGSATTTTEKPKGKPADDGKPKPQDSQEDKEAGPEPKPEKPTEQPESDPAGTESAP